MDAELAKLEGTLKELFENQPVANEKLYKLGIQVGRHLEKNNLADYRATLFSDRENRQNNVKLVRDKVGILEDLLLKIVKCAIKETLESGYIWTVGTSDYYKDDGKFDEEISEKYFVQLNRVNQEYTNGDFQVDFDMVGELNEAFKNEGFSTNFMITVSNRTGEDYTSVYKPSDLESVYDAIISYNTEEPNLRLENLDRLMDKLPSQVSYILLSSS